MDAAEQDQGSPVARPPGTWRAIVDLLAAVAVAAAAAYAIVALQDQAERATRSQVALGGLRAAALGAVHAQESALLTGGLGGRGEEELAEALRDGEARLASLQDLGHLGHAGRLVAAFGSFRLALGEGSEALRGRRSEEARRVHTERTEPALERLELRIEEQQAHDAEAAASADRAADAGTIASLVLAALVITGLGALRRRSQHLAIRAAAERSALVDSERRYRGLVQHGSEMVTILGADLRPTYHGPSVERVLGWSPAELDRPPDGLVHPEDLPGVQARLRELAGEPTGCSTVLAFRIRHRDGRWRHVETVATNLLGEPSVAGVVLNTRDVTERTVLEGELVHRALHDPLTDLPNRALLLDRVDHALERAGRRDGDHTAVVLLDVDHFKSVIDSLGHAAGDEVLAAVADRLRRLVRPADTVARLSGDEFAVLLEDTVEIEASALAQRILDALVEPVTAAGRPIVARASVGVATSRYAGDATALLRNADLAMYAAKEAGRGRVEVFRPGMHEAVQARLDLEADLRSALGDAVAAGELRLVYQPQVSLVTGNVVGVEALLRWEHPRRGTLSPGEFVPLAEDSGLIVPIGAWVLEEACRQAAAWARAAGGLGPVVAVNVSGRQFTAGLCATVAGALATSGLRPERLCLEVTESVVMQDVGVAMVTLRDLKALGVQLSIDDFGTGYSSLSYIKQFPLDELKIDRSFVEGLGHNAEDDAIVAAIMGMARALGLDVVAEGVETDDQAGRLRALDCETAQGFLYFRPMPATALDELLAAEQGAPEPAERLDPAPRRA